MLTLTRIKETESCEYSFTEQLLTTSFPINEYRDLHKQQENTRLEDSFHLLIAKENGKPIGFISYWSFEDFCYVEHFATDSKLRNKGYGKAIMKELQKQQPTIVLEVEMPENELAERRINFYRRLGFILCEKSYVQPPYRRDDKELPMMLMSCNCNMEEKFDKVKQLIHRKVYGIF